MTVIQYYYENWIEPKILEGSEEDAEIAHERGLEYLEKIERNRLLAWLVRQFLVLNHPMLETTAMNINFSNPFGLAAGFDKNARVFSRAIPASGWGFETIGAVLRHPQLGNPRPRLLRSKNLLALWNWLGFNSDGVSLVEDRMIEKRTAPIPIILNIGKNKEATVEQALTDYACVVQNLWRYVDAFEINPSSPNTPGLRDYQQKEILKELLEGVQNTNSQEQHLTTQAPRERLKPVGIKVSPDETDAAFQDIIDVAIESGVSFLTLTNTTVDQPTTRNYPQWAIPSDRGGISGGPLGQRSLRVLTDFHLELKRREVRDKFTLISAGGILDGYQLYHRITSGADLCEALTGWVFRGPDFTRECLEVLIEQLRINGHKNVRDAVGTAVYLH